MCDLAWAAECDAGVSAPCGVVQDTSVAAVFCTDVAPPALACSSARVDVPLGNLVVQLGALLTTVDDNTAHFVDALALFKVSLADPTAVRVPYLWGIPPRQWRPAADILAGTTHVTLGARPARTVRPVTITVTDRSGNSGDCVANVWVRAPAVT